MLSTRTTTTKMSKLTRDTGIFRERYPFQHIDNKPTEKIPAFQTSHLLQRSLEHDVHNHTQHSTVDGFGQQAARKTCARGCLKPAEPTETDVAKFSSYLYLTSSLPPSPRPTGEYMYVLEEQQT